MKKHLLSTITFLIGCFSYAQVPVLYYDFERNTLRGMFENAVEQAVNSNNTQFTASGLSNFGGVSGAGLLYSGSVPGIGIGGNQWITKNSTDPGVNASQYFQFSCNTSGLSGLSLNFDCSKGLNGAPNKVGVLWSTDGVNFFQATTLNNSTSSSWSTYSFPLGAGADNQTNVVIRIYAYDAGTAAHFLYLDNVTITATTISGQKTLLDYDALGLSLASGTALTPTYSNLAITDNGTLISLTGNLKLSGTLSVTNNAIFSCIENAVVFGDGSVSVENGSTIQVSSVSSTGALRGNIAASIISLNPAASVEYNGNGVQFQDAAVLANVIVNNDNGVIQTGDVVINGNLTLKNGTMRPGAHKLTIRGNVSKTNGRIDAASTDVIFDGISAQTVAAGAFTGPVKRLNISNLSGVTFDTDVTVSEAINLTTGKLNIGTKKLTIRGTLSRNGLTEIGTIDAQNGSLEFGGTLAQAIPAGALHNNKVKNLRISNTSTGGVSLNAKMDVTGVLDFGAVNNGNLKSNNNLTLKSDATNTARVADLTNGGANSGNTIEGLVTVERYFVNNGRRYRLVTPGVTTTTSIRANWQEGVNNTLVGVNINPVPGYGTQITGSGGATNGFDATQTNNASLFTYNQATGSWVAVTNTNVNTLSANRPYLIFLRGDRSVDMTAGGTPSTLAGSATILRATGTLATGEQSASSLGSNGAFSLISNPYASPVSWTKIHGNNNSKFEEYYTYWDPKVGSRGAYVTVTTSGLKSHATVAATTEIQSGQAFFVKTKAGVSSPSLSIREQDKSAISNIAVMRTANKTEQLGISLFYTDALGQRIVADGVTAAYGDQYSAAVDAKDALQMASWDEDIAIVREGKSLSIETRPLIRANDTVYMAMARMKVQSYELQFDAADFDAPGFTAYLVDKFMGTETLISTSGTTVVPFSVTTNTASSAATRFMVVFKTAVTLPLTYTSVKATETSGGINVEWKTASETSIVRYEVERSADAITYTTIANTTAKGQVQNDYSLLDRSPFKGNNYYRIKAIEANGDVKYSQVVVVKKEQKAEVVSAYPNPIPGNTVFVQLASQEKGTYTVSLVNSAGVTVQVQNIVHSGSTTIESISLLNNLAKGVYLLQVKGPGVEKTLTLVRN